MAQSRLGPFGDEHRFLTVSPQPTGAVPRWDTDEGSADLAFIGRLLDRWRPPTCVDEARV